ncbi:ISPg3 transposase [Prevotella dentalis DSM 3688]|uniref:ISPg3 transposase n=1 Tax=Prevotella dentalis (strain ATCC 49559 / DSM 3688 / JCM 13448 / NCTC 12043 / ES 2772) TaxID=908937 RepID=F9CZH4_PREDD|nr:ISPg3 transposase [Prevotella dentalis DSM 3688]
MTILVYYHFGTYRNFKEYYFELGQRGIMCQDLLDAVSYNRFVELMPRVFCRLMLFMKLFAFGRCSGISYVDSTMIPICHNVRRYYNKVFAGLAKNGKERVRWDGVMASSCTCSATTLEKS